MIRKYAAAAILISVFWTVSGVPAGYAEDSRKYKKTYETYTVPDVTVITQDNTRVRLRSLLNSERPVMVDFVFTTCTTICPVLSAGFSNFQKKMGPDSAKVQLLSISIDPENDTPKAMKAYLQRYSAKKGWDFVTGSREDIDRVLKALNASVSNKMAHLPLILMKAPHEKQWVRIYGLMSTADLMKEYQAAVK